MTVLNYVKSLVSPCDRRYTVLRFGGEVPIQRFRRLAIIVYAGIMQPSRNELSVLCG